MWYLIVSFPDLCHLSYSGSLFQLFSLNFLTVFVLLIFHLFSGVIVGASVGGIAVILAIVIVTCIMCFR